MLSKVDLRDFFEINQGLYNEPASSSQIALIQAMTQALDRAESGHRAPHRPGSADDHNSSK